MANNSNRLNTEWLVINALRENLSLITDNEPISYNETIRFVQENSKNFLNMTNLILAKKELSIMNMKNMNRKLLQCQEYQRKR
jgi:hypothetical protein